MGGGFRAESVAGFASEWVAALGWNTQYGCVPAGTEVLDATYCANKTGRLNFSNGQIRVLPIAVSVSGGG